jgi:hypothetical protein
MNGFISFDHDQDLESFLTRPEVAALATKGQILRSSSLPVLIFREVAEPQLSGLRSLAELLGGRIRPSMRHEPL